MTLLELRKLLNERGINLSMGENDTLTYCAPMGALNPDLLRWLKLYKPALIDALMQQLPPSRAK